MFRGSGEFAPVIAELARNALRHFGSSDVHIKALRRIDGPYSSVLNVRVYAPEAESTAYIKVFKPLSGSASDLARVDRFLQREFRATTELHEALAGQAEIGALRPIACLPEHRAIVTAEVAGRPFSHLLDRAGAASGEAIEAARRVGRWVALYQRVAPVEGQVLLAERREYIDDRLRLLQRDVLSRAERQAVLASIDELCHDIGAAVPAVAIHADLTPANVLVGHDGRVTVLDFTMAKTGTTLHDLAHMYFHLASFGARRRSGAPLAADAQGALLEGYAPSLTARDPLFQLMLYQHAVCHVAMLAERRVPVGRAAYAWYLRRRWKQVAYFASSITRTAE